EAFVHGAMCVSVSGRCFLSSSAFGTSANQGACKQPCRREFYIKDIDGESDYILGQDYVLSPKDLCTIEFLDRLIEAGIHSFKIEGRMRSEEYIKIVVSSYRRAIDAYFEGKLDETLKTELREKLGHVYNRKFSTGFYFGKPREWVSRGFEKEYEKVFIGDVVKYYGKIGVAEIIMRSGKLKVGDRLLVVGKNTPASFADVLELQQEHESVPEVVKGDAVAVKLPFKARRNDQVFIWKPVAEK
ncbi:MAG: U32 family peptidase, partial [bacterium]|nr:U32 family peptidase [bacterium]